MESNRTLSLGVASLCLVAGACGGGSSPTVPSGSPSALPLPSPTPVAALPTGVSFGADVVQADQDVIQMAYSLTLEFWGAVRLSVFAYSTIDAVLDAYSRACSCSAPWYARQELESEFTTTAPGAFMVVVGSDFRSMNRDILIGSALIHSMTHAIQRGYTDGFVGPVWMAEGGAECADVHAGVRDVEFMHRYGRNEARDQSYALAELEAWPNNSGFNTPFGRAPYNLGHFGTDLLVSRSGKSAALSYWQTLGNNLRRGMSQDAAWRAAFQSTFGIPVSQFYAEFEAYRSRGFQ